MAHERKDITPPYGYLARLFRPFPDFDPFFIKPVRQKAVELLHLKVGDRVLDVGCGPGGSFPYLVHAVGQSGQVVGVEISPEISINARRRIERNGWRNVEVIEAAAQDVHLTGTFDALLMFAAADVYASEEALENVFPHLNEKARVAAFGAKLSSSRLGRVLNPFLRMLFNLSFSTTPRPDYEPWRILAKRLENLDVEEYFFGLMFLCSGSVVKKKAMNARSKNKSQSLLSTVRNVFLKTDRWCHRIDHRWYCGETLSIISSDPSLLTTPLLRFGFTDCARTKGKSEVKRAAFSQLRLNP